MTYGTMRRAVAVATKKQAEHGGCWVVVRCAVRSGYQVAEFDKAKLSGSRPLYVVRDGDKR